MLTKAQEKLIRSLQTKKGRDETGLCLVEGEKVVEAARKYIDFEFAEEDSKDFKKLVTTVTPQMKAAVARIPTSVAEDVLARPFVVVLDGVQDPGNVGAILRLCLGFDAGLFLVDSADPANSKVIRSSAGAMFQVPWQRIKQNELYDIFQRANRPIYRLEKRKGSRPLSKIEFQKPLFLIAGSEGRGITLDVTGTSITVEHDKKLESLNVGHAIAIALHAFRSK
jgi:TrmH family RNA methyltransferase